ncbi:MAG: LLM class flavin-dependent oxidoreductase [Acidimicrobiia bacterium]
MRLSIRLSTNLAPSDILDCAGLAERSALWGCWFAENPYERSAAVTAAVVGQAHPDLRLGLGVVVVRLRHPIVFALDVSAADAFCRHPLRVGLGAGLGDDVRRDLGLPVRSGLALLSEQIDVLRSLLRGGAVPSADPSNASTIAFKSAGRALPVLVGAVGPKTLTLSAELSDGVVLSLGSTIAYLKDAIARVNHARATAPDRQPLEVVAYSYFGGNLSREEMEAYLKPLAGHFVRTIVSHPEIARLVTGLNVNLTELGEMADCLQAGEPVASVISDDVVDELCIWGPPDRCAARLADFENAGVTELAFGLGGWVPDLRRAMGDVAKTAQEWARR